MHTATRLGLCLLLCIAGCGADQKDAKPPDTAAPGGGNTLLISWDGVRRDTLREMLKTGELPHLAKLMSAGSIQDIAVGEHLTQTRPGHAEMLTGLAAATNRILSNSSPGPIPAGLTLFDRLKQTPNTKNVVTAVITGKTYVGTLFAASMKNIDTYDAASRLAGETGPAALAALKKHKQQRFFAFVHFADPDAAGHGSGEGSSDYLEAIVTCDRWLGKLVAQLKQHGIAAGTLVYVTSDHGFDKGSHSHHNAPDIWLVTNDKKVNRGGTIADITATIMQGFGLDLEKLEPGLTGKPLTGERAEEEAPPAKKKAA